MQDDHRFEERQPATGAAVYGIGRAARPWTTAAAPAAHPRLHPVPAPDEAPEPDGFERAVEISERLRANLAGVVRGKPEQIRLVLTALACEGHVLFEDVPGTAK